MQTTLKKAALATGLAASVAILALTGCQSTSDRTVGRKLDDRIVNHKVKDRLDHETVYKFPEVRVMTYDGVVQLAAHLEEGPTINATCLCSHSPADICRPPASGGRGHPLTPIPQMYTTPRIIGVLCTSQAC